MTETQIYQNMIDCLEILKPLDVEGEPNTLLALVEKAMRERDALRGEVARLREANRWIPVSERLPEDGVDVIIFSPRHPNESPTKKHRARFLAHLNTKREWALSISLGNDIIIPGVTHWRPLPEPPEVS